MPVRKTTEEPLTLRKFIGFYEQTIEPRFCALEARLDKMDLRFDEVNKRLDDLYKKFETLHQEYLVICEQLKRIEVNLVTKAEFQATVSELKTKIAALQDEVDDLERRVAS